MAGVSAVALWCQKRLSAGQAAAAAPLLAKGDVVSVADLRLLTAADFVELKIGPAVSRAIRAALDANPSDGKPEAAAQLAADQKAAALPVDPAAAADAAAAQARMDAEVQLEARAEAGLTASCAPGKTWFFSQALGRAVCAAYGTKECGELQARAIWAVVQQHMYLAPGAPAPKLASDGKTHDPVATAQAQAAAQADAKSAYRRRERLMAYSDGIWVAQLSEWVNTKDLSPADATNAVRAAAWTKNAWMLRPIKSQETETVESTELTVWQCTRFADAPMDG